MSDYIRIAVDLVAGFILLFIIAKILGKTQISQITAFEFISALILGELVGNAIFDEKVTLWHIIFAMFIWGLLMYTSQIIGLKVLRFRGLLEGNPSIVVKRGQMDQKELKKNKMSINQLQIMLRQKDIFSLREVEYVILEPTGVISVLKKDDYNHPTKQDLAMSNVDVFLPLNIIIDGRLLRKNMESAGFNDNWLRKQLAMQGYEKVEDVFYAEWTEGKGMYIEPMKEEGT